MNTVRELYEKINIDPAFAGTLRLDEPMKDHTTFRLGGLADLWVRPEGPNAVESAVRLVRLCRESSIPCFILGGGANIVVSDRGIRGVVLDTTGLSGCTFLTLKDGGGCPFHAVRILSGTTVDDAAETCADHSLSGLDFLAGMPGTVGGAVWMNARCYGHSVSDALLETEILDERLDRTAVPLVDSDFGYKRSPFQSRPVLILSAVFRLEEGNKEDILASMTRLRTDREGKGHFRLPSGGSSFKNDYAYGKPTGQVVDELGLRGLSVGGAQVAPWHGNIIVNTGTATAQDVRELSELVARRVEAATGLRLESEILFVGDW